MSPPTPTTANGLTADTKVFRLQGTGLWSVLQGSGGFRESVADGSPSGMWVRTVSGNEEVQLWNGTGLSGDIPVTETWQWLWIQPTSAINNVGILRNAAGDDNDVYVCAPQLVDLSDSPDKNPPPYVSVGVGVQDNLITTAITASDFTAFGTNTITDNKIVNLFIFLSLSSVKYLDSVHYRFTLHSNYSAL